MEKQTTAIRKSFDQLTPNEYEHYFYVVRLLLIFAPDAQDAKQYYFTRGGGYNIDQEDTRVIPKCMYDAFISIHASCCEHSTEIFPYWHRWLMIKYESYLLKAHNYLISSTFVQDQTERLLELAKKAHPLDNITQKDITDLLTAIQKDYQGIIGNQTFSYIPAHYWNVFQPSKEINYPLGYINKKAYNPGSYDNIDKLIRLIWDQDSIYEINFTTRYEMKKIHHYGHQKKPENYQYYQELLNNTDFWATPEKYSPEQIQKAYNFVVVPGRYLTYQQYLARKISDQNGKEGQDLNKLYFNVLDPQSVNYIFGGKGYSYYPDITKPSDSGNPDRTDPLVFKSTRNNNIGYYSYCRSLYTNAQDFITKFTTTANNSSNFSMQSPHNSMHNNQQYCMQDSSFSVTNPIFFAYHSLIDLMLEYKIDDLKSDQTNQSLATNSIQNYFNESFTIHGSSGSGEFNVNFKENWLKQQQSNNSETVPTNADYPVLKWVSPTGKSSNQVITNNDYVVVPDFTYTKIILDQPNTLRNLSNIIQDTTLSYYRLIFDKDIQQIKTHVPNPYSPTNLYVALQIRHRSTIQSTNLNIELKNMNGKILTTQTYPIFSRGKDGKCPNCTEFKTNKVLFPVEELQGHFTNLVNIRKNGIFEESAFSQVQSRINIASSLSYNLSSEHVTARFVSGRQNLNILVTNNDKEIKVYLKSEEKQISKSKAIETFRTKKPITFNVINGTEQKRVGTKQFNILGAQAQLNGKTLNYNFPFFSEESEIVFDFSKDGQKIGLSETPCIGQNLNNVYELTTESTPQIYKNKKKMAEEKAEVKPKLERITLTYNDFE